MSLNILQHPLAEHLLAGLRDINTEPEAFRIYSSRLTTLLAIEATRMLPTVSVDIQTPLETTTVRRLSGGLAVVPVLRAGLAMLEPIVELFPDVKVGYIGLERDHNTAIAHSYYSKLPRLEDRVTLCVDPMLATGGSAAQAVSLIKAHGAQSVVMVSVVAAPEGVAHFENRHPDVPIITAALDRGLNEKRYILPGLGDFGDRLYGTM